MRSTFMGLETARRGMFTQQSALHTTGHNISNANTPGYTRQRINFEQTEPYPNASINRPQIPGQVGTGVKAGSIQRIRESFLDVQYRGENNKLGYWETRAEAYTKLEEVLNEPSDSGLAKTMDLFWQSLQDLAVNPTNAGARSVVRQRGIAVAETFNHLHISLSTIKQDLKNEITVTERSINSILEQISKINGQIADVEPHQYLPNDLYDERDRLIDQLSSIVNVKVDYSSSGKGSLEIAEGQAIVKMISDSGKELGILVSGDRYNEVKANFDGVENSVKTFSIGHSSFNYKDLNSTGQLKALVDSYGVDIEGKVNGIYPDVMKSLDDLAYTFANEFNAQHSLGVSPNEIDNNPPEDRNFFAEAGEEIGMDRNGFAGRITLAKSIEVSLDNIATASGPASIATKGDSSNVLALANIFNQDFDYQNGAKPELANFHNYYEGVIGELAVRSQEAVRLNHNSTSLKEAVDNRRKSVSSVSLDEEMTNMIQFQHAYNASARMITLQDEMLDKIINGMGTVGR
ncbi:flagellar hook-associated protein FlgK [Mesobacillus jeotgali]|uniref:Flagellar hook-associated protein 1 n=1 Tax=Mesobacillus jeotgali TaxID=129985 RepID=A0ABY9VFB6_9BACI|nr:flagellar hook-associated protein FlgK [Mesobacillus jeotgali]WNF22617.1 flagellar hook-associated protein FlgK [Mesobacillus jeotgali]